MQSFEADSGIVASGSPLLGNPFMDAGSEVLGGIRSVLGSPVVFSEFANLPDGDSGRDLRLDVQLVDARGSIDYRSGGDFDTISVPAGTHKEVTDIALLIATRQASKFGGYVIVDKVPAGARYLVRHPSP